MGRECVGPREYCVGMLLALETNPGAFIMYAHSVFFTFPPVAQILLLLYILLDYPPPPYLLLLDGDASLLVATLLNTIVNFEQLQGMFEQALAVGTRSSDIMFPFFCSLFLCGLCCLCCDSIWAFKYF